MMMKITASFKSVRLPKSKQEMLNAEGYFDYMPCIVALIITYRRSICCNCVQASKIMQFFFDHVLC